MYFNLSPNSPFGIRWSGNFYAPYSGTYTFTVTADDGFRFSLTVAGNSVGSFSRWDVASTGPVTNTYQVMLTAGTTYAFGLDYFEDGAGGGQISLSATAPTPPSTPLSLTGYQFGGNINLSWNADPLAAYYPVYRAPQGGAYTLLANSPTNTYTDTTGTPGVSYYYLVYAFDNAGNHGPASNSVLLTFPPPAPGMPLGLSATPGNASVALAWTAPAGSPTSYNVKRSLTTGGPYSFVSNVTATSYTDTSVSNRTQYYYVVSAVNAIGEGANSAEAGATPGLPDDAVMLSQTALPSPMTPGQTASVTVVMKNVGTNTWSAGDPYYLGGDNPLGTSTWAGLVTAPTATASGQTATFTFPVTAPSTPGTYNFQRHMVHGGLAWFGTATTNQSIVVGKPDDAQFVSQSPPPSVIRAGMTYPVSVTMKNVGTSTWTTGGAYTLTPYVHSDGTWQQSATIVPTTTAPGQSVTIPFTVTAPAAPGSYRFQWQMLHQGVNWFGAPTSLVTCANPADDAQFVSSTFPATMTAGQSYPGTLTMKNVGTNTWTDAGSVMNGDNLNIPQNDPNIWGVGGALFPARGQSVAPGQSVTFGFTVTAPTSAGTYPLRYQMLHQNVGWFGDISPTRITVTPVTINLTINLTGTTPDATGNQNILVGQGCKAILSGIPSALLPYTTYAWSVSGTTFQDWEPTTPPFPNANPPTQANSQASYYDPGPGIQTNPTYHWYWNDLGPKPPPETVKCTATVTPPAGQGSPFTVTATQNVTVYVPTRSPNTNTIGDGRVIQSTLIAQPSPTMINNLQEFGSSWTTGVSLPATPAFGSGQWCYAQLIIPGEYLTIDGVLQTSTDTTRGEGLDASFPYMLSPPDTGLESTDGYAYHEGDSPNLPVNNNFDSATLTDTFHTWVMFKPPGNDVRWVPLSETRWSTDFMAYIPAGGWTTFPATETTGSMALVYDFVEVNNFPMWTQIVPNKATFNHQ